MGTCQILTAGASLSWAPQPCSVNFLAVLFRHIFQLQPQVHELVERLLVDYFLDGLLLDLRLGAARSDWLAELLDPKVFLGKQAGLRYLGLLSDLLVYFPSDLGLLRGAPGLNELLDLEMELLAVVVDVLDQAHVVVQFQLNVLQDLDRRLGLKGSVAL